MSDAASIATDAAARLRYARRSKEIDLRRAFDKLDAKHDKKIDADELMEFFKACGENLKRSEVEDMIWEVDEDCDGCLSWPEFQQMYNRCDADTADFEPRQLFDVIQFIVMDKEGKGTMRLEQAMQILYLRHGRANLDAQMRLIAMKLCESLDAQLTALFGTCDLDSGKVLTLREFINALHSHQVAQLRNSKVDGKSYKAPLPGKPKSRD